MLRSDLVSKLSKAKAAQEGFELQILNYLKQRPNDVFNIHELTAPTLDLQYPKHEELMTMISPFIDALHALVRAGLVESFGGIGNSYYGLSKKSAQ